MIDITPSRASEVGAMTVRRALPTRGRRTVGSWCFADHMGPHAIDHDHAADIGPHPHIGLQTVTWILRGELLHRDSLGSEQLIRPGQLNLMTAGAGVSHSEESVAGYRGPLHGIQLWVAQPDATRHGHAAFEHHASLPQLDLGDATGTVLVGSVAGASSSARRDTDHLGVDLDLRSGTADVPLREDHEHALVVLAGHVEVVDEVTPTTVSSGVLAYLGTGRHEVVLRAAAPARVLLLGGEPFPTPIQMWWNFVGRDRTELDEAGRQWNEGHERFGETSSPLPRIPAPTPMR